MQILHFSVSRRRRRHRHRHRSRAEPGCSLFFRFSIFAQPLNRNDYILMRQKSVFPESARECARKQLGWLSFLSSSRNNRIVSLGWWCLLSEFGWEWFLVKMEIKNMHLLKWFAGFAGLKYSREEVAKILHWKHCFDRSRLWRQFAQLFRRLQVKMLVGKRRKRIPRYLKNFIALAWCCTITHT